MPAGSGAPRHLTLLVSVIAAIAAIWLIRAAAIVLIPLAAAFFVTVVVYPVESWLLGRVTRRRWAAHALTMALILATVGLVGWAVAESVDEVVEAAPRYEPQLQQAWQTAQAQLQRAGLPVPENGLGSADLQQRLGQLAASAVGRTTTFVSGLVLVFFLVLLMLIEAPAWREQMRRAFRDNRGSAALDTIGEIAAKVRTYLYVRTVLGLLSAGVAGAWLLVMDVDLVLVWVVLTFALNYIPNVGSVIAVIPPSLMAFLQHGPALGLVTLGGLTLFEQIIGNFIDPRVQGNRLRISPVVVLMSLVFWTWAWGTAGAVLAVPMTVTLLVTAAHIRGLEPLSAFSAGGGGEPAPRDRSRTRAA